MRCTLRYVGVQVRDMDRSVAFYRDLLGMDLLRRQEVPETGGEWAELRSAGSEQLLELNWYPEGSAHFPGPYRNGNELDHLAFECEDARRDYDAFLAKGAKPGLPPFLEGGTWLSYIVDPDGIWIELYSPADPQG
jgi:lactoylglutathione lyase